MHSNENTVTSVLIVEKFLTGDLPPGDPRRNDVATSFLTKQANTILLLQPSCYYKVKKTEMCLFSKVQKLSLPFGLYTGKEAVLV